MPFYYKKNGRSYSAALVAIILYGIFLTPVSMGEGLIDVDKMSGVIEGQVVFKGEVPKDRFVDDTGSRRPLLSVHRRSGALQYAIVFVDLKSTTFDKENSVKHHQPKKAIKPPEIDQKEHTFLPHILAIRDGQKVAFTNSDSANHNIRAISLNPKNQFNIFSGGGGQYEHMFKANAKNRPIRLSCDIHPWMRGWIYLFEHPFYAVTNKKGEFRIPNVPPGEYQLIVRQPDISFQRQQTINVVVGMTTRADVVIEAKDLKSP